MRTPPLDAWAPWTPQDVARRLEGIDAPWHVVGGWAIDLWLERQTRPHHDIEIALPRRHFAALRERLEGRCVLYANGGGTLRRLEPGDPFPRDRRQCWVAEGEAWRLDAMLEEGDETRWVFRRDARLTAPYAGMVARTAEGIPHLVPQAVLLFKARGNRPKDDGDFALCLPLLDDGARTWLADALALTAPDHPWRARL